MRTTDISRVLNGSSTPRRDQYLRKLAMSGALGNINGPLPEARLAELSKSRGANLNPLDEYIGKVKDFVAGQLEEEQLTTQSIVIREGDSAKIYFKAPKELSFASFRSLVDDVWNMPPEVDGYNVRSVGEYDNSGGHNENLDRAKYVSVHVSRDIARPLES